MLLRFLVQYAVDPRVNHLLHSSMEVLKGEKVQVYALWFIPLRPIQSVCMSQPELKVWFSEVVSISGSPSQSELHVRAQSGSHPCAAPTMCSRRAWWILPQRQKASR